MSRYDADDTYCITGTSVLKNKAGIADQNLLDEFEADFTAIRLLELAQTPVIGVFDLAHLCKIHEYLFQDVYDWAGKTRSVAENAGYNLDYSALDQTAFYPVMQASFHGDEVPLTELILRIIT